MVSPLRSALEFEVLRPYDPACAQCAEQNIDAEAVGFCDKCRDYLCFLCIDQHRKQRATRFHAILEGKEMPTKSEFPHTSLASSQALNDSFGLSSNQYYRSDSLQSQDSAEAGSSLAGSSYGTQDTMATGSSLLSSYTESLMSRDLEQIESRRLSTDLSPIEKTSINWPDSPQIYTAYPPFSPNNPLSVFSFGNENKLKMAKLVGEYDIRYPGEKNKCWVWASVVLPNGDLVISDNENNNIKLFDSSSRCKSVLRSESYPVDLCLSNIHDTEIYATVSGGVHHIGANAKLKIIRTLPVEGFSNGITCWKHGIAITVSSNKLTNEVFKLLDFQLHLLDYNGKILKKIHYNTFDMFHLNDPWYLETIAHGQQVVISDWGTNCITCIDVDKGIKFVFKDPELNGPRGMCTDEYDNIYIVGWLSENVVQISPDGEKQGAILSKSDGLYGPAAIAYDRKNKCVMLQDNKYTDTIQIYRLT